MDTSDPLDIATRSAWPPELRFLVERYPRQAWDAHANLGDMARFWLSIHDGFRGFADSLAAGALDFREDRIGAAEYRRWLAPRLRYFLSGLEHHHQIEDHSFFPVFGTVEPRLVRGFDVLERDHGTIHAAMDEMVATANAFLAEATDRDALRRAADRYAGAGDRLQALLLRHLDDEEDLVIPLILERGEGALGL
ncbi:MAG TPA: hemerythrin domain-containing protein [Bauldia sp.]|nr:hemerythrin domain-containing protein [Bauldia sp.]